MASQPPGGVPSVSYGSQTGSQLYMLHATRVMKVYPIVESELSTITIMNVLSALGFSIGGIFVGIAINVWINASFYKELVPEAQVMVYWGAPISLVLGLFFFAVSVLAVAFRSSTWRAVRRSASMEPTS